MEKLNKSKMSIREAEEIIYAYACCGIGKCESCPLAGDPISNICNGDRLKEIGEAVKTINECGKITVSIGKVHASIKYRR